MFGDCALHGTSGPLAAAAASGQPIEMENFFSRLGLDIIGKVGRVAGFGDIVGCFWVFLCCFGSFWAVEAVFGPLSSAGWTSLARWVCNLGLLGGGGVVTNKVATVTARRY
jgi:hypothetical protein